MFTTYEVYKARSQRGDDSTTFVTVEYEPDEPWLLLTTQSPDNQRHTFMSVRTDGFERFAVTDSYAPLVAVRVVLPPSASPTGDWFFVPIRRIDMEIRSKGAAGPRWS